MNKLLETLLKEEEDIFKPYSKEEFLKISIVVVIILPP